MSIPALTVAEKAVRFGCYDRELAALGWEREVVRRLETGEVLSRADTRTAKRIKKHLAAGGTLPCHIR